MAENVQVSLAAGLVVAAHWLSQQSFSLPSFGKAEPAPVAPAVPVAQAVPAASNPGATLPL